MARTDNPYAAPTSDLVSGTYLSTTDVAASRWKRLGAVLLDLTILAGLQLLTVLLIDLVYGSNVFQQAFIDPPPEGVPWFEVNLLNGANYIALAIDAVVFFLINGYLLAKRGQSIGKVIVNIAIVNVETHNVQPFVHLVISRYAPIYLFQVVMFFAYFLVFLVDALLIFRSDRRTLHDMMAGTTVIDLKLQERMRAEGQGVESASSNLHNPEDL